MTDVQWTLNARRELRKAFTYIAKENHYAAKRVRDAIANTGKSLAEFPSRGRPGTASDTK